MDPKTPTSSLPSLKSITIFSRSTVAAALINLRSLYWPSSVIGAAIRAGKIPHHKEERVPDSGYASAEEEGEEEEEEERLMILRADPMERAFAIRWLTGFIVRSEEWVGAAGGSEFEQEQAQAARVRVVEEAIALLALSADTQADGALSRDFSFAIAGGGSIKIELKDEPYATDHESVGLQTWGSASVLADRICADPEKYLRLGGKITLRILELGAGTGLLSLVVGKLSSYPIIRDRGIKVDVLATDYHPAVLKNLQGNIARNFPLTDNIVRGDKLDWVDPPALDEDDKFDVILAADVIYDKRHGAWIKACAERMLRRSNDAIMWMIIPRRPTRTGEVEGVDEVFHAIGTNSLTIVESKNVARHTGVGRADECGYRLFEIGWGI